MDNPLVQPDPGLFLWTILTFLVLFVLLRKYAWKPLLKMLEDREETIRKSLDDAAKAKQEIERLQQESKQIIAKARVEAQSIIAASRTQAEKVKAEILQDAKARTDSILQAAEKQIQAEKEKAITDLRNEVIDLSLMMASKLIRKNITPESNRALIEESLKQIESHRA
ncbi:F0F1 ATP synthase subunit B [Acidobacteria bacterium AH-259-O06]|nr:F0F1 ATP synthase subunit B [Acidobacteria bacterium AH-259-O06]